MRRRFSALWRADCCSPMFPARYTRNRHRSRRVLRARRLYVGASPIVFSNRTHSKNLVGEIVRDAFLGWVPWVLRSSPTAFCCTDVVIERDRLQPDLSLSYGSKVRSTSPIYRFFVSEMSLSVDDRFGLRDAGLSWVGRGLGGPASDVDHAGSHTHHLGTGTRGKEHRR